MLPLVSKTDIFQSSPILRHCSTSELANAPKESRHEIGYVERETRGPFLETPGNLTGPNSDFEIKVPRKVGRDVTSNEVRFVSLANNFTV